MQTVDWPNLKIVEEWKTISPGETEETEMQKKTLKSLSSLIIKAHFKARTAQLKQTSTRGKREESQLELAA